MNLGNGAQLGRMLFLGGLLLVVCGALLRFGDRLSWRLGQLPADLNWAFSYSAVRVSTPLLVALLACVLVLLLGWLLRR